MAFVDQTQFGCIGQPSQFWSFLGRELHHFAFAHDPGRRVMKWRTLPTTVKFLTPIFSDFKRCLIYLARRNNLHEYFLNQEIARSSQFLKLLLSSRARIQAITYTRDFLKFGIQNFRFKCQLQPSFLCLCCFQLCHQRRNGKLYASIFNS